MGHVRDVRGAAGFGRIDVARAQAHVVDHAEHAQARRVAGAEVAIDVTQRKPRVFEGAARGFGVQLGDGLVRRFACGVLVGTHDTGLSFDAHGEPIKMMKRKETTSKR